MIASIATVAAAIITVAGTVWVALLKIGADKTIQEQDRQDRLEERVELLEKRIDEEAMARREAESHAHSLTLALERALDWIMRVMQWIEAGARPPSPEPPDVAALKTALIPRARRPPD